MKIVAFANDVSLLLMTVKYICLSAEKIGVELNIGDFSSFLINIHYIQKSVGQSTQFINTNSPVV